MQPIKISDLDHNSQQVCRLLLNVHSALKTSDAWDTNACADLFEEVKAKGGVRIAEDPLIQKAGINLMLSAMDQGRWDLVDVLCEHGVSVNSSVAPQLFIAEPIEGLTLNIKLTGTINSTPLSIAISEFRPKCIQELLKRGLHLTEKNVFKIINFAMTSESLDFDRYLGALIKSLGKGEIEKYPLSVRKSFCDLSLYPNSDHLKLRALAWLAKNVDLNMVFHVQEGGFWRHLFLGSDALFDGATEIFKSQKKLSGLIKANSTGILLSLIEEVQETNAPDPDQFHHRLKTLVGMGLDINAPMNGDLNIVVKLVHLNTATFKDPFIGSAIDLGADPFWPDPFASGALVSAAPAVLARQKINEEKALAWEARQVRGSKNSAEHSPVPSFSPRRPRST